MIFFNFIAVMKRKYAIIDIETTGCLLKRDQIIEIAIVVYQDGKIIDKFQQLVAPGRTIPPNITMLTGITNEMMVDTPRFYEVARKIVEMTEDAVFVAHNVRFDYSFIKEAFRRLGYTYTRKQLCTVRLSKILLPELSSHGLGSLIRHLKIPVKNRHRAIDDVEATLSLFKHLLSLPYSQEAMEDIINAGIKGSKLPAAISLEQLHDLPEACGVYYFHNVFGDIIYVGKSKNIKKRVMQHFAEHTAKSVKLQQQVQDISYELTGSELVALLKESHEIKKYQPEVNRAQRQKLFPFALYYYTDKNGYINFQAAKINKNIPQHYTLVKEYPKLIYANTHLRKLIEEFELCSHKCGDKTGMDTCFNFQVDLCGGACNGTESEVVYNERAYNSIDYLQRMVRDSFFIIDEGRDFSEKSVVLVEQGQFKGFGYVSEGTLISLQDQVHDLVDPLPNTRDAQRIIHWYLKEKKPEKIVYLQNDSSDIY